LPGTAAQLRGRGMSPGYRWTPSRTRIRSSAGAAIRQPSLSPRIRGSFGLSMPRRGGGPWGNLGDRAGERNWGQIHCRTGINGSASRVTFTAPSSNGVLTRSAILERRDPSAFVAESGIRICAIHVGSVARNFRRSHPFDGDPAPSAGAVGPGFWFGAEGSGITGFSTARFRVCPPRQSSSTILGQKLSSGVTASLGPRKAFTCRATRAQSRIWGEARRRRRLRFSLSNMAVFSLRETMTAKFRAALASRTRATVRLRIQW